MKRIIVLAAVLASVLAGCTTVNTVERAKPIGNRDWVPDKRVISDPSLNRRVRIVSVNDAVGAGGLLKVQVELRNETSRQQAFNYIWEWFDESGMIVKTPLSTGTSREIEGKESIFITGMAPNVMARDFRLKLIEIK